MQTSASAIAPVVREAAPKAVCHSCYSNFTEAGSIRWMGNEAGMMPLPSWACAKGDGSQGSGGNPLGEAFMPPSSDAVLREHYWFYQNATDGSAKTALKLVHNYLTSVGRAANLILNVAPDGTGAIPADDVSRYAEMGAAIECLFSQPLLDTNATGATFSHKMAKATGVIEWDFASQPVHASNISFVVREDQREGQLIGNYTLQCAHAAASNGG